MNKRMDRWDAMFVFYLSFRGWAMLLTLPDALFFWQLWAGEQLTDEITEPKSIRFRYPHLHKYQCNPTFYMNRRKAGLWLCGESNCNLLPINRAALGSSISKELFCFGLSRESLNPCHLCWVFCVREKPLLVDTVKSRPYWKFTLLWNATPNLRFSLTFRPSDNGGQEWISLVDTQMLKKKNLFPTME